MLDLDIFEHGQKEVISMTEFLEYGHKIFDKLDFNTKHLVLSFKKTSSNNALTLSPDIQYSYQPQITTKSKRILQLQRNESIHHESTKEPKITERFLKRHLSHEDSVYSQIQGYG